MVAPICETKCGSAPGGSGGAGFAAAIAQIQSGAPQTILDETVTQVLFATDEIEIGSADAQAANNQIVVGEDGAYEILHEVIWGDGTAGFVSTVPRVNGADVLIGQYLAAVVADGTIYSRSSIVLLSAGDVITLFAEQDTGGARDINGARLTVTRVG
jgi:hypothetical protein